MTAASTTGDEEARQEQRPALRPKPVTLRADQWSRLDDLARSLQDARTDRTTARITANTVIRVAIDGVLAHPRALRGNTEAELRTSWLSFLGCNVTGTPTDLGPTRGIKTATIRTDQWATLDQLARDLHDARTVKGERITANTVIRVAIDGITTRSHAVSGETEDQIRDHWLAYLAGQRT